MPVIGQLIAPKPTDTTPVVKKGPDGNTYNFPPGTNDAQIERYYRKKGLLPAASVEAQPAPFSIAGLKSKAMTLRDKAVNQLPTVGGILGGLAGGSAGLETGPGAVAAASAGAAAGGGLGEDLRQSLTEKLHPEDTPATAKEAIGGMAKEAFGQGLGEATGQALGRWFRPTLESTMSKIFYSADLAPRTELDFVMPEIQAAERSQPVKTVGDFVKVVGEAKTKIGNEVDTALRNEVNVGSNMVPLSSVQTDVTPIADEIQKVAVAHPSDALANPGKIKAVKDRIKTLYSTPKTYHWLNDRRIVLNDELNRFYSLKTPADKSLYLSQHPHFEIDKAEADAIRDVVYPQMDKAAGKPPGYFASLQRKRGTLKSIESQAQEQVDDLAARSRKARGAPMTDPIRAYGSSSGHGGFTTRLGALLGPTNPAKPANRQMARAFVHTPKSKVGEILGTRPGMEVMSLPVRELFAPAHPEE